MDKHVNEIIGLTESELDDLRHGRLYPELEDKIKELTKEYQRKNCPKILEKTKS